jgi:hypothetical protein
MLALLFASPDSPDCRLLLLIFDGDYQKLSTCADRMLPVPANQILGQDGQLPCILVPQAAAAEASSGAKVS